MKFEYIDDDELLSSVDKDTFEDKMRQYFKTKGYPDNDLCTAQLLARYSTDQRYPDIKYYLEMTIKIPNVNDEKYPVLANSIVRGIFLRLHTKIEEANSEKKYISPFQKTNSNKNEDEETN